MTERDKIIIEILKEIIKAENINLMEDRVDPVFQQGANFGMKFITKIASDCLEGNAELLKEVYCN